MRVVKKFISFRNSINIVEQIKFFIDPKKHGNKNVVSHLFHPLQVGTNNCTTRYRTLSGGIGNSPSPTHSSDYVDDDDDDDDLTTNTAVHNGLTNSSIVGSAANGASCGAAGATSANIMMTNNLKSKRNNLSSHLHKASSTISYQKATVHYVSGKSLYFMGFTGGN